MTDLTQQEWASQFSEDNNAIVLDVRTSEEYEEGHIPNAVNNDIYGGQAFIDNLLPMDKAKNYYVYCRSGKRSAQACQIMKGLGYTNTYNLLGGILEWEGAIVE
ncbi:rhodanese-like domain-containing protein [Leptobacterium sp. I13]|uniref:rhodanese-like domain-containing protein n=1 Tax=Leptobacterium meishanense TaxID=3128904 RepID=UPI0030ED4B0B